MSSWKMIYIIAAMTLQAQTPVPAPSVPLYRVTVEQNSATAINYRYLKGSTKIDFKPTPLAPTAKGMAKVASAATTTDIYAKFQGLPNPTQFGPEYLTYVLWAVSPEGRASNLGEILLKKGDGKVKVTEPLQSFGLVVTAEPYFAVTQPSNLVVLENAVRKGMEGQVELIDARFDLLKRGTYSMGGAKPKPMAQDKDTLLEVYEARNAVSIAMAENADAYAPEAFSRAMTQLQYSETVKGTKKEKSDVARMATQNAEDARLIAVKRQAAESLEIERAQARASLEQARQEADQANARAALSAEALAASDRSRGAAQRDNTDLRARLLEQLSAILETRATARGLIVDMSGMTFNTSKSELLPLGREKLAKIAGLILAHPGLKMEVEGYTDSTGSDQLNQALSEKRAVAARDYLVTEGVASSNIVARGLGKAAPIETNTTVAGRSKNRRVELVVSGTGITDSGAL